MGDTKKSKMIFGRYIDKIENRAVSIPWLDNKTFELPCFYTVFQHNEKVYVYVHCNALNDEDITVIDSGECTINENSKWIVPESVLSIVGDNECVWLGVGDRAELLTEKRIKEAELSQEELKGLMLKLLEKYDM